MRWWYDRSVTTAEAKADDPVLAALSEALRGRTDVHVAIVFGSRARGDARPDSDLDVGVFAPGVDVGALGGELEARLGVPVEAVSLDLDTLPVPLLDRIVCEGRVVHELIRGAGASWWSRALITLETDRPWYRRMSRAWLAQVADKGV